MDRIIDLSESPAGLSVANDQLIIRTDAGQVSVPLAELAVIVVSHPGAHYTHAVLRGLCEHGGSFVLCDERRLPVGMLLPLTGNFVQSERFAAQASATLPTKKSVWNQLIRAKILSQGESLRSIRGTDAGLPTLAAKVRGGDEKNLEAQAARRYWSLFFGDTFSRVPGSEEPINRLLNYGYAVLRGIIARGICAAGLHPSLGVHHHNRYNAFCLADDLMEPFRPLVDLAVFDIVANFGADAPLDKTTKQELIGGVVGWKLPLDDEERTLFDCANRSASSLSQIYLGKRRKLALPEFKFTEDD